MNSDTGIWTAVAIPIAIVKSRPSASADHPNNMEDARETGNLLRVCIIFESKPVHQTGFFD